MTRPLIAAVVLALASFTASARDTGQPCPHVLPMGQPTFRNDATPAYSVISVAELRHFSGIDPFPALPRTMNATAMDLPPPTPHPGERSARRVAFAWLASGESVADSSAPDSLQHAIPDAGTILSLALAYAR